MGIIDTLKNRNFLKHIGLIVGVTIIILIIASWLLKFYTRHSESVIMPNYVGKTLSQAEEAIKNTDFEIIVRDSIYDSKKPKGTIYSQEPSSGSKVKKHRKIYVTMVALGSKKIDMPALVDLSLRQATQIIENSGLKLGQVIYQPSQFENAVLEQRFKGKQIETGTKIDQGSTITLIVGKGGAVSESEEETE